MGNQWITCPQCGTEVYYTSKKCSRCGADLQNVSLEEQKAEEDRKKEEAAKINEELKQKQIREEQLQNVGMVYYLEGARGRKMRVYEDRCEIVTDATLGSMITGNVSDGEKTIYFADCIGIQFKKSGVLIGYLQIETAAPTMNNEKSNFFNENSFTYTEANQSNEKMTEVYRYIKGQVALYKKPNVSSSLSVPDEIRKYKELLDMGAINLAEYEDKKKQLLKI